MQTVLIYFSFIFQMTSVTFLFDDDDDDDDDDSPNDHGNNDER